MRENTTTSETILTSISFPDELQQMQNWLLWKLEGRNGKSTKVPYTINGSLADTTNPVTWTSFSAVQGAHNLGDYDGIGCVIQPPYVGIDLDKCRDPESKFVEPWALEAITMLDSYTELSPSGKGFHIWVKGTLPEGGNKNGRVEAYARGRYFTVTHQHVDGTPTTINERDLTEFHSKFIRNGKAVYSTCSATGFTTSPNNERDTSPSAKEFALVCSIARELGPDATEADIAIEFFSRAAERPKWTENSSYVSRTIEAALKSVRGKTSTIPFLRTSTASLTSDHLEGEDDSTAIVNGGIVLPGGQITITASAKALLSRIAPTKTLFVRGRKVHRIVKDHDELKLEILSPVHARSEFEKHSAIWAYRSGQHNETVLKRTIIPLETAAAFLACESALQLLPQISGLINCAVIVGSGQIVGQGYHRDTGLFITGGELPHRVELPDAIEFLQELVGEFEFESAGDRSRAIASFITPALKLGGHLHGNIPVDIAEANTSQSGKTYRQRLVAAVYNEKPSMVTSRNGGVGSVDESLNAKLAAGRPFILFDNFRGKFDSPHVEALLTAEKSFPVRLLHTQEFEVDPSRFFLMLTSNGVDTTRDFANRGSIVRNRKREGYRFRQYCEGDLLEHVRACQSYYLGAVFAVVQRWIDLGRQRSGEIRHDFREWAQTLDWIVQTILGEAPLMDGHQAAQERVSNPDLTFLRNLALAVADQGRTGESLIVSKLYEIADSAEVNIPGLRENMEEKGILQIGKVMSRLFKITDTLALDGFTITRQEVETEHFDSQGCHRGTRKTKTYKFGRNGV